MEKSSTRDSFMHGQSFSWIDRIDMLPYLFTRPSFGTFKRI